MPKGLSLEEERPRLSPMPIPAPRGRLAFAEESKTAPFETPDANGCATRFKSLPHPPLQLQSYTLLPTIFFSPHRDEAG
jgi:hypothetical protein